MFDNEEKRELREAEGFARGVIIRIVLVFATLGLVLTTVNYLVTPLWGDLQTRGTEHSYTFVQTKRELLVKLVQDYRKAEAEQALHAGEPTVVVALEAQKKSIRDRIRSEASAIPSREIPGEAQPFLEGR